MANSGHKAVIHRVDLQSMPQAIALSAEALPELEARLSSETKTAAYEEGARDAIERATQEAVGALHQAVERVDASREQALDQLSVSAVELAVEIARQIIQVEVRAENYDLERIIRTSLSHSGMGRGSADVHVSSADFDRLSNVTFRKGTQILPNPQLSDGDVHIDSPNGLLVREIDVCLDNVREQLLEDVA